MIILGFQFMFLLINWWLFFGFSCKLLCVYTCKLYFKIHRTTLPTIIWHNCFPRLFPYIVSYRHTVVHCYVCALGSGGCFLFPCMPQFPVHNTCFRAGWTHVYRTSCAGFAPVESPIAIYRDSYTWSSTALCWLAWNCSFLYM